MITTSTIENVEISYQYLCVEYYESLGEHDACMYMSSIELSEAQKEKAYKALASGKRPDEIALELFNEDFLG